MSIRVMVAEPQQLLTEAIGQSLRCVPDFELVATEHDQGRVAGVARLREPQVLVLGSDSFGQTALGVARSVCDDLPLCRVLLLAARPTRSLVDRAVAQGVLSVVPKDATLSFLVSAVRGVADGRLTMDGALMCRTGGSRLSEREREFLHLTASGASINEIAGDLSLVPGTVRNLSSTTIRKLRARNRYDAARIALENGWL